MRFDINGSHELLGEKVIDMGMRDNLSAIKRIGERKSKELDAEKDTSIKQNRKTEEKRVDSDPKLSACYADLKRAEMKWVSELKAQGFRNEYGKDVARNYDGKNASDYLCITNSYGSRCTPDSEKKMEESFLQRRAKLSSLLSDVEMAVLTRAVDGDSIVANFLKQVSKI